MNKALKYILFFSVSLLLACELDVIKDPQQESTFVKFYGGNNEEEGKDIVVRDSGYTLLGTSSSFSPNQKKELFLVKVDKIGNLEEHFTFKEYKGADITGKELLMTKDGYTLVGYSTDDRTYDETEIIQTDFDGELKWEKQGINGIPLDIDSIPVPNTGYFLLTKDFYGQVLYLSKIDLTGVLVQVEEIETEIDYLSYNFDLGASIEFINDECVVIVSHNDMNQEKNIHFYKFDYNGNLLNTITQPSGLNYDVLETCKTSSGGVAITGYSNDSTLVFGTFDESLEPVIPVRIMNDPALMQPAKFYIPSEIIEVDNGFLISTTASTTFSRKRTDIKLIKLNAGGIEEWAEAYTRNDNGGNKVKDEAGTVIAIDKGYVITGTFDLSTNLFMGLLRTNERGELISTTK